MTFQNFRITQYDGVVVPPVGLVLHFSNSQIGAILWDAGVKDVATGQWVPGVPSGIKEVADPPKYGGQPNICAFAGLTGKTFLLTVQEITYGMTLVKNFGPYLVTIPEFGEYTWNSMAETIDGISTVNLPKTNNRSLVIGPVNVSWGTAGFFGIITIEEARDVPGYMNVARYFIGESVYGMTGIPSDPYSGQVLVPNGTRVQAYATLRRRADDKSSEWYGWDMKEYPEYPAEAFSFTGSLTKGPIIPGDPWYGIPATNDVYYQISGKVSSFAVCIVCWNTATGFLFSQNNLIGPASGTIRTYAYDGYGNPAPVEMYAHPDPNKVWNQYSWQFYNWKRVASC